MILRKAHGNYPIFKNNIWKARLSLFLLLAKKAMTETAHFLAETTFFRSVEKDFLEGCKGQNLRLVFVGFLDEDAMADRLDFLKKILLAVQLDLAQDCVFRSIRADESASFFQLLKKRGIERAVVFGLTPKNFGLAIEARLYEPFHFYGVELLFSEKLSLVETDQNRKKQLWSALKRWI